MTAQKLAGRTDDNATQQIFDSHRLRDELHHAHPMRAAAACVAARAVLALADDRLTFFEGTRAEVWAHIFDDDRLQAEIERGRPSRNRPADPLRAVGAQMVIDAVTRLVALRSSIVSEQPGVEPVSGDELRRVRDRFERWMRARDNARRAA
jgi:hypothetical protein